MSVSEARKQISLLKHKLLDAKSTKDCMDIIDKIQKAESHIEDTWRDEQNDRREYFERIEREGDTST